MNAFMFYKKYRIPKNKIKFFKKFTTFYVNLRQFTPFFFTTKQKQKVTFSELYMSSQLYIVVDHILPWISKELFNGINYLKLPLTAF